MPQYKPCSIVSFPLALSDPNTDFTTVHGVYRQRQLVCCIGYASRQCRGLVTIRDNFFYYRSKFTEKSSGVYAYHILH